MIILEHIFSISELAIFNNFHKSASLTLYYHLQCAIYHFNNYIIIYKNYYDCRLIDSFSVWAN